MINEIEKKYGYKFNLTYLTGVIIGVNAIKDAAVLIDSPDCIFFKSDIVFHNHDFFSTLKSTSNGFRIFFSGITIHNLPHGHEKVIVDKIAEIFLNKKIKKIFLAPMPMVNMLGVQYDSITRDYQNVSFIKGNIDKDWIDGYESLLLSLAKSLDYNNKNIIKGSVSVVGYLFDRNEGDNIGNINELTRLLNGIGLKVNTIWLNGNGVKDLSKAVNSDFILSLPYGRQAAKFISSKIDAKLIEVDLPFSIESTIEFLEKIGKETNNTDLTKTFIKKELKYIQPFIVPFIRRYFLNKKVIYGGDIQYINGIHNFSELLGFGIIQTYGMGNEDKTKLVNQKILNNNIILNSYFGIKTSKCDFLIKNSIFPSKSKDYFEFGLPSVKTHYITENAFLGFRGALNFIQGIINLK